MGQSVPAFDPKDSHSGPQRHLLADSEAPRIYQQTDQSDLNPRLDSHASSTSNLCFTQDRIYFEGRTIVPTTIEARQQPQQSVSLCAGIKSPLRNGEQEISRPFLIFGALLDSQISFQRAVYPDNTCATCQAPLGTSEQSLNIVDPILRCTRDKSHLSVECASCNMQFLGLEQLKLHCDWHDFLHCAVPGCDKQLCPMNVGYHFRQYHPEIKYRCSQCGLQFNTQSQLDQHGEKTMHGAYVCHFPDCGSESSRIADLNRHQLTHKKDVERHPCLHCRKYRGNNGFKRKDHLRQHVRNYHHIEDDGGNEKSDLSPTTFPCHFENCDKVGEHSFDSLKALKVHLKKEHPSPFQCPEAGCGRVGSEGWFRESDMVKHMRKAHGI